MEQGFLDLARTAYWLVVALFLALALWLPATRRGKIGAAALVAIIALIPTLINLQHREERKEIAAREQVLVSQATRRFEELCKGAGVKIYRTVDDVDAVLLLKVRPTLEFKDQADPMLPGAAMAGEAFGDAYIESFLGVENRDRGYGKGGRGTISGPAGTDFPRYRYVDIIDPNDGQRYRYSYVKDGSTGQISSGAQGMGDSSRLVRRIADGLAPRYAVDYEDIVNREDRKLWIAGTTIRVRDQQSGEILGEYTTYLMDGGMGTTDGTRAPWSHASHSRFRCPQIDGATSTHTRYFVDGVLKPAKGISQ